MAELEMSPRSSQTSRLRLELSDIEELTATLAGVADGITVQDPSGRLLYANPMAAKMVGFECVEELLGTPLTEVMQRFEMLDESGAPLPHTRLPGRVALAERRPATAVVRFRIRATGEERESEVKATPALDEQGRVRFAVNVFRDITEERRELARRAALVEENARLFEAERRARAAAEQAEQRLAQLAEASRVFAEASLDYGRLLELVARSAAQLIGDRCAIDLLSDDGAWLETVAVHDVAPTGVPHDDEGVGERLRADDDKLQRGSLGANALAAPLMARGHTLGVLRMTRRNPAQRFANDDLMLAEELAGRAALAIDTARAYEAERRARASAESATRAREELLAVVSHELRSPLTTINISAAVVQEQTAATAPASGLVAPLHAIQRSVMSMQRLIQDLLDLARLDAGSLVLDQREYDVRMLLEQSIEMHQPLAAESGQRIVLSCEHGSGRVRCDRERAFQVLANLLSNAIKFSPAGAVIYLRVRRQDGEAEISVRDQGPGVPREHRERIFERYFQGNRADGRGVGLGLSIAKGIVEEHGGRMGVDSGETGARFWFTLPGAP